MPYDKPCTNSSRLVSTKTTMPKPTFTVLGVEAGVSTEEGRPAREGGRMELAVLGREIWAEPTEAEVDGRKTADAKDAEAGVEDMVCQTMPSEQSLKERR
jgi:hypothetical protein